MPRFLQIGIAYGVIPVNQFSLDRAVESEALDWLRLSPGLYLVWTTSDAETICRKMLYVPGMEGAWITVLGINPQDGFGFLPPVAWQWFTKDRGVGQIVTWTPPWTPPSLTP